MDLKSIRERHRKLSKPGINLSPSEKLYVHDMGELLSLLDRAWGFVAEIAKSTSIAQDNPYFADRAEALLKELA